MRTIATNADNDIYIDSAGSLAIVSGLDAVMQVCEHACLAQLGEMIYAADKGMPTMATLWSGNPKPVQYEAAIRSTLLSVEGVTRVLSLRYDIVGEKYTYSATIETIYGVGSING